MSERLFFNGIDGRTGQYLLPPMPLLRLADMAHQGRPAGEELANLQYVGRVAGRAPAAIASRANPGDLAQAGWAVVFAFTLPGSLAAREQAAIREALSPLLDLRRRQAGARDEDRYRVYAGELGYRRGEPAHEYLARLDAAGLANTGDEVPYYLLLVASPAEITHGVQARLGVHHAVGRLCFERVEDYAAYARGVVAAETGLVAPRRRSAALFGVTNPGDQVTALGIEQLVRPLAAHIERAYAGDGWSTETILADVATRARLGALLADPPALVLTSAHGVAFPAGDPRQEPHQGALICQDWGGPAGDGLAREHYFAAEDLDARADLRGMIALHAASFSAGTCLHDHDVLRALAGTPQAHLAAHDLTSGLPGRMLANAGGGALAVIGHTNHTWGNVLRWTDPALRREAHRHLAMFESAVGGLLRGQRVGHALAHFRSRHAEMAAYLGARLEELELFEEAHDPVELAQLWLYSRDARDYVVIGDPAVRIPGAAGAAAPARNTPTVSLRPRRESGAGPAGTEPPADGDGPMSFGIFSRDKDEDEGAEPGLLTKLATSISETVGGVIRDVVELEVKTYISPAATTPEAGPEADIDIEEDSEEDSDAGLCAASRCKLAGGVETRFVPSARGIDADRAVWALHLETVKHAQANRNEMMRLLISLIKSGVS